MKTRRGCGTSCKRLQALGRYGRALANRLQALPKVLWLCISVHVPCPLRPLVPMLCPVQADASVPLAGGIAANRISNSEPETLSGQEIASYTCS